MRRLAPLLPPYLLAGLLLGGLLLGGLLLGGLLLGACRAEPQQAGYVARVGSTYLTQQDLDEALASLGAEQDTAEVRAQVVEQWVTNELLHQEALRRGLQNDAEVRELIAQSERSVLVSALLESLLAEAALPSEAEMQTFYDERKEDLRLIEPYVRVRILALRDPADAPEARRLLQRASADALWQELLDAYGADPQGARLTAERLLPESQVFPGNPALQAALEHLVPGQTSAPIDVEGGTYVLQLVERAPAGTVPELDWVRADLTQRLQIQARKQNYARLVERLRSEALAQGRLDPSPAQ